MLGPNPNPRLFSSLPACESVPCQVHLPSPLAFPTSRHLSFPALPIYLRTEVSELRALGEVAIGAQPPKRGLSLFVCLSFSRTKKPGFPSALEANSLFTPKTSNQNWPVSSSQPLFIPQSFYVYIDPRATELTLAILKGILQALGRSLETRGKNVFLCWYLGPWFPFPALEKCSD